MTDVEEYDDSTPDAMYDSVESFVTDHLALLIQRHLEGAVTWCPQWQEHPEAVDRLTALWEAWEALHVQGGTARSTWWLDHADPHLAVLMDADRGPFVYCSPTRGHAAGRYQPLPFDPRSGGRVRAEHASGSCQIGGGLHR